MSAPGPPPSMLSSAADELAPLDDPYLMPRRGPPRSQLSMLAVSSVLAALLVGPVGAVAAIVFGLAALREIDDPSRGRTGRALAATGIALGVVFAIGWGATMGTYVFHQEARAPAPAPEPDTASAVAQPGSVSSPPGSPAPAAAAEPPPSGTVPKATTTRRVGSLTVVDVGVSVLSLADELAGQRAEAARARETLVVMTTASRCVPCQGVDASLRDPLMQTALANVRLVRVDREVFSEDLDELKLPRDRYPGFFLLSPNLTPKDGVDGGEWDADVAANIAPVLGAFVRGKYAARRQPWRPVPDTGIRL